nr:unnamed protein product [Callosobruchus analis]
MYNFTVTIVQVKIKIMIEFAIKRSNRSAPIYVPDQYIATIRQAKNGVMLITFMRGATNIFST